MSDTAKPRMVNLGEIDPAGSRHAGRRSAVAVSGEQIFVGTATGDVAAYDRSLDESWRAEADSGTADAASGADAAGEADVAGGAVVSAVPFVSGVAVGERSPRGEVRLHDRETGAVQWRYRTATDVGTPQKNTRFFLPFVVDAETDGDRLYVAARRYERQRGERSFESCIYAFAADGEVVWRCETDASPVSLDVDDDRLAVAYNRCPGSHERGLVVLDAETGDERYGWDPETAGQRRVGDVSLLEDGAVVTSHADFRGYRLETGGSVRWSADLATPVEIGNETLYAYPNHVHATPDGAVFVTGNTYACEGRETDALHPKAHTAFGYAPDGERVWSDSTGGFAAELATDRNRLLVPGAQAFRTRDAAAHGLRAFGVTERHRRTVRTEGVVTAAALDGREFAAVEEPVTYHDEEVERGAYRLLVGSLR